MKAFRAATALLGIVWTVSAPLHAVAVERDALADPLKRKAATACQNLLAKVTAKVVLGKLKALDACGNGALSCVQTKSGKSGCLATAAKACGKKLSSFATTVDKARLKILAAKSCTVQLSFDDLLSPDGLGLDRMAETCHSDFQLNICSDIAPLAECLSRAPDRAAGVLYGNARPRMAELLGRLNAMSLPVVEGLPPAQDCGSTCPLASPSSKAVEQCAKAATKATINLVKAVEVPFAACAAKAFACIQGKPGDAACLAKVRVGCDKSAAKINAAFDRFEPAITETCGEPLLTASALSAPVGLNFAALGTACAAPPTDAVSFAACLRRNAACVTTELVRNTVGRAEEFGQVGRLGTLDEVLATECPVALTPAATLHGRAAVFGSITKFLKQVHRTKNGAPGILTTGGRPPSTPGAPGSVTRINGPKTVPFGAVRKIPFGYRLGALRSASRGTAAEIPTLVVTVGRGDTTVTEHFEVPLDEPASAPTDAEISDEVEVAYADTFPACAFTLEFAIRVGDEVGEYTPLEQKVEAGAGAGGGSFGFTASNGPEGGRINAIAVDPTNSNTIYAGAASAGVFKSVDAGATWSPINEGFETPLISSLLVSPTNSTTLYAGTTSSLFKSTDAGTSWTKIAAGLGEGSVRAIAAHPTNGAILYVATSGDGVFKTTDAGNTWNAANSGLPAGIQDLVIDPVTPDTVYAAAFSGVFKTINGGMTWSSASTGLIAGGPKLAIDPTNPSTLYVSRLLGDVYKTTNGGASWAPATTGLSALVTSFAIHPSAPNTIYAGAAALGRMFKSTNGGISWTAIDTGLSPGGVQALAIDPANPATLYAGAVPLGGGVFKTVNSGDSWVPMNDGLIAVLTYQLEPDPADPSTLYVASEDGLHRSDDGGTSWLPIDTGTDEATFFAVATAPGALTTIYAGGSKVLKSIDGGGNWSNVTGIAGVVGAFAVVPGNPDVVYAASTSGIFKTVNAGSTWDPMNDGLTTLSMRTIVVSPVSTNVLYAGSRTGVVFKSIDGGENWNLATTGISATDIRYLVADASSADVAYAGTIGGLSETGGVFVTVNGGTQWAPVSDGMTPTSPVGLLIGGLAVDQTTGNLAAAEIVSVYRTSDVLAPWTAVATLPSPISSLTLDPVTPGRLYVSTFAGIMTVP